MSSQTNYVGIQNEKVHQIDQQTISREEHTNRDPAIGGLPTFWDIY